MVICLKIAKAIGLAVALFILAPADKGGLVQGRVAFWHLGDSLQTAGAARY